MLYAMTTLEHTSNFGHKFLPDSFFSFSIVVLPHSRHLGDIIHEYMYVQIYLYMYIFLHIYVCV